ncbi:MAG: helix-turn-helix domain-containing protein [Clostridia bacterium]|nr:helix-turn-helix domain-containing protein [Clostridia bacterium]
MKFSQRLKELRKENALSQSQLAQQVGVSQSMIVRWESGECEPTASNILKLSEVLNCSTDYLLGKKDI